MLAISINVPVPGPNYEVVVRTEGYKYNLQFYALARPQTLSALCVDWNEGFHAVVVFLVCLL